MKDELKSAQSKDEVLEKDHIALVKEVSDKPLDDHEMTLQKCLINDFNRTKHASMIYGVSRRKREALGYSQKTFNPRFETLSKTTNTSSSTLLKKELTLILHLLVKIQRF